MLLNIHPAYRSSLHSIQLLAVVKSSVLKVYGIDAIMKPAVDDLLKLAKSVRQSKQNCNNIHGSFILGY